MEAAFEGPWPADETLIAQVRADPEAFAGLYMRYHLPVYFYLLARLGDVQEAQDLSSMVFLAALRSIDRYRGAGHFLAWLLGIARNQLRMYRRGRRPALPLELLDALPDPAPAPPEAAESAARLARIVEALGTLPPAQAEAIRLRIFAELPYADIARLMGRREGAVRMLVQRGLATLRERLPLEEVSL